MVFTRITSDPRRMNGQPCIRSPRLTVRRVVEAVAAYPERQDLKREYPELEEEDIREALAYAAANLEDKVLELASRCRRIESEFTACRLPDVSRCQVKET